MKSLIRLSAIAACALAVTLASTSYLSPVAAKDRLERHAALDTRPSDRAGSTYTSREIIAEGHRFFGTTTKELARAVEYVFERAGPPRGYIIGQEGSGAFIGGLRYGEGILYLKNGTRQKVYWQGPSLGFDFGGNGSRTLVLVYDIAAPRDIFDRFIGVEGSAYLVGGLGVNFQSNEKLRLAPIRTGVGARLGANVGYLKYTSKPTWNPF